jgi:hypothetical protein
MRGPVIVIDEKDILFASAMDTPNVWRRGARSTPPDQEMPEERLTIIAVKDALRASTIIERLYLLSDITTDPYDPGTSRTVSPGAAAAI